FATGVGVAPSDPNVLYAGLRGGGLWRSSDGAAHWQRLPWTLPPKTLYFDHDDPPQIAIDPSRADTVLAAVGQTVWRSADGGTQWTPQSFPGLIAQVLFSPSDAAVAYVVTAFGVDSQPGVYRSVDHGATWVLESQLTLAPTAVVVDPSNPN